jgi:hypothetical protein
LPSGRVQLAAMRFAKQSNATRSKTRADTGSLLYIEARSTIIIFPPIAPRATACVGREK